MTGPVLVQWHEAEVRRFLDDPNGPLGVDLMRALGEVVLEGARRRALRRTGAMIKAMRYDVMRDEQGLLVRISSPVQNPKSGFPYAQAHERKKTRDRRPHRSLKPALRDIRKILKAT